MISDVSVFGYLMQVTPDAINGSKT